MCVCSCVCLCLMCVCVWVGVYQRQSGTGKVYFCQKCWTKKGGGEEAVHWDIQPSPKYVSLFWSGKSPPPPRRKKCNFGGKKIEPDKKKNKSQVHNMRRTKDGARGCDIKAELLNRNLVFLVKSQRLFGRRRSISKANPSFIQHSWSQLERRGASVLARSNHMLIKVNKRPI